MFHRVIPDECRAFGLPSCYRLRGSAITPAEWEAFLDTVGETCSIRDSSGRGVTLTFDDGYREWVDLVAPSLRDRGLTATFFGCRAFCADAPQAHAVDRLYWLLDHAEWAELLVVVGGERLSLRVDRLEGKRAAIQGPLKERIVVGRPAEVDALLDQVALSLRCALPGDLPSRLYPTEAEWRALAAEFELGAHGLSHRRSTALSDDELRSELEGSRRWILGLGGVDWWCHPDGDNDARVRAAVQRAGFVDAAGVDTGSGPFDRPRRFATPAEVRTRAAGVAGRRIDVANT
jgi:hypothetical protein